jgi:hypothetical protein
VKPAEITALLVAGGVSEAMLDGTDDSGAVSRYDGLRDIRGCTALANELAGRLRAEAVDAILTGPSVEEAVLAACTGASLGINVVRSFVDEGLLFAPRLQAGMRLIVLSDAFHKPAALNALWSLANERGSHVSAVGVLYEVEPAVLPDPALTMAVLLRASRIKHG